jgi:hypothetical protein
VLSKIGIRLKAAGLIFEKYDFWWLEGFLH